MIFRSTKFCQGLVRRRRRPASEQDKFFSGVKTVQILQFARHDLKKKFLSAPTITKLKIWQRQILSRFLVGPNKFCQSSLDPNKAVGLDKGSARLLKHPVNIVTPSLTNLQINIVNYLQECELQ